MIVLFPRRPYVLRRRGPEVQFKGVPTFRAGKEISQFAGIAVLGVAHQMLDAARGLVTLTPNVPVRWEGIRVVDRIEQAVHVPVHLVNDARACTLARAFYARPQAPLPQAQTS